MKLSNYLVSIRNNDFMQMRNMEMIEKMKRTMIALKATE